MQKIPSLFERDWHGDRQARDQVTPGCEWVVAGEGRPTRKWDGTCCLIRGGKFFKRYEVKKGGTAPPDFEPACEVDPVTGKQQGWVPVGDGPQDQWHREAFASEVRNIIDGTYELVGPKVQGNPEGFHSHHILAHGYNDYDSSEVPVAFHELKEWLGARDIEGIVWHHPDGRMCKVKKRDFGLERKP